MFEIDYVGTRGTHLFRDLDINTPPPGPGDVNARRPFAGLNPNITSIHDRRSDGNSYFNALEAKLSRRFSNGFQALVSYTYSKTIDTVSNVLNPYNDALNRGLSAGFKAVDIPNNFVASYTYELPFGAGQRFLSGASGVRGKVVTGWSLNGITTARSGEPLVVTVSNSLLNNGSRNYANIVCDHPGTPGNVGEWFDTGCFTNPPAFTYGNAGMTCGHARKGRIETRLNTTADCVSPAAWRYALLILLLGPKYSMKCQRLCGLNGARCIRVMRPALPSVRRDISKIATSGQAAPRGAFPRSN